MALGAGREVEAKRCLCCMICQAAGSTTVWLLWQITFLSTTGKYLGFVPSPWTCFWFLVFQASQLLFLIGKLFVTTFQEKEAASVLDLISGIWKMTCIMVVGTSVEPEATRHLTAKISTTRDQVVFLCLCTISGFLSLVALASTQLMPPNLLDIGVPGAALGLVYACLHLFQKKEVLAFPLIQQNFAYSLKLGSSRVLVNSVKLTVVVVPAVAVAGFICAERKFALRDILADGFSFFIWQQIVLVFGAICATVCWELCHHFVQVVLTRRHVFAPPLGSTLAETQPSEQLLSMLEDVDNPSLAQHLAYLDLCIVAESNVDTWRRTAFFEVTGETYKRIIKSCLGPLDNLTLRLAKGLEIFETKSGDFLKQQVQSQGLNRKPESIGVKEIFGDLQLCDWCARTVASLTTKSRLEDRFGVAQLSGCNKATLSSLLSCLLVVEVYLGRRSSTRGVDFVGFVPSQGNVTRRKGSPFGKGSVMHKKAYALADILRTLVYQIIDVFGEEMVGGFAGWKGVVFGARHWLSNKPLYGTQEMHVQSLSHFLEHRMGEFRTPVRVSAERGLESGCLHQIESPSICQSSPSFDEWMVIQSDGEGEEDSKPAGILRNEKPGLGDESLDSAEDSYGRFASPTHVVLQYKISLPEFKEQCELTCHDRVHVVEEASEGHRVTEERLMSHTQHEKWLSQVEELKVQIQKLEEVLDEERAQKKLLEEVLDEERAQKKALQAILNEERAQKEFESLVKVIELEREYSYLEEGGAMDEVERLVLVQKLDSAKLELEVTELDSMRMTSDGKDENLHVIEKYESMVGKTKDSEIEALAMSSYQASETPQKIRRRSERVTRRDTNEKGLFSHVWTSEEDAALAEGILIHGQNWAAIAQSSLVLKGLDRKQCRQRSMTLKFKQEWG